MPVSLISTDGFRAAYVEELRIGELLPQSIAQGRSNAIQGSLGRGIPCEWPDDLDRVFAEVLDGAEAE